MNKGEFVNAVAARAGLGRAETGRVVDAAVAVITDALRSGQEVKIVGFGTFEVVERGAREARNPRTSEKVVVPAGRAPRFRAGASLKEALNPEGPSR